MLRAATSPVQKRELIRTAYAPHYRQALARQQSRQGQRLHRLRQRKIESVCGSLLQYYGLRRVNTRGRRSARKTRHCLPAQKAAQVSA